MDLIIPTIISRCRKIFLPGSCARCAQDIEGVRQFLSTKTTAAADRNELDSFLRTLLWTLRDALLYRLAPGQEGLINRENYEIISPLRLSIEDTIGAIEGILDIYEGINNINVKLACNLLKIQFS